ncbi:MAG TPA: choice-of-anchor tandem repeat GloVer-containing protein, partial [Thermoanaerobaculia bacterium]|nr:choice-of-anchor tandem repeat GloVer-containing protein [Thermoanaerobaculia bacterium]
SPVTFDSDGNVWGATTLQTDDQGNGIAQGTLFKIAGGSLSTIHSFTDAEGMITESGGVTQAADGNVYGVTRGTTGFNGVFFRTDVKGNYRVLASVPDTEVGYVPYRSFYKGLDGKLYGQTQSGGGSTYYTIDATQWIDSISPTSGPASGGTPVTITGAGFVAGAGVEIGGIQATDPNVPDATHVTADTPVGKTAGSTNLVKVRLPDNTVILLEKGWFADFLDVPQNDIFHDYIEAVARVGITAGCGGGNYCRDSPVTRAQMAVFLEKAKRGADFVPPACVGTFPDVPCSSPFAPWIEQLAADGITGGCGGGNYCPDSPVLRQQMAVFLLKGEHGSAYDPPDCAGIFDDVPCTPGAGFSDWIEQLVAEAITGGCQASPPLYCPLNDVTRGQMAVFLTKTFAPS